MKCFEDAGYQIGKAADAISSARAWTKGWHSQAFKDSIANSRELGARIDSKYYGETAYSNYMPYYYMVLKCILLIVKGEMLSAKTFYAGYIKAKKEMKRVEVNEKVISYFKFMLFRIFIENWIVFKNNFILGKVVREKNK